MAKNKNRSVLIDHQIDVYSESLNMKNKDEVFEYFSAEQILKDYNLDPEEIFSGLVGGGLDNGIDGFYIFVDGDLINIDTDLNEVESRKVIHTIDVHIHQYKNKVKVEESVLLNFIYAFKTIVDIDEPRFEGWSEGVVKRVEILHELITKTLGKGPRILMSIFHVSKGKSSDISKNTSYWAKVASLKEVIQEGGLPITKDNVEFRYIGSDELLQLFRKVMVYKHNLKLKDSPVSLEYLDSNNRGYMAVVNILDYYNFITDENKKLRRYLFDENIRDFQNKTTVNKDITKTLEEKSDVDFWWLNNGVTIICSNDNLAGKTLTLDNVQIVNGLQTSYSIYNHFNSLEEIPKEDRSLLVKIVVTDKQNQIDNIIKSTNSQNNVPSSLLRATDEIQRDIEDYFLKHGYYYDRRKNFYKNQNKPLKFIVTINYLAQCIISVLVDEKNPSKARSNPTILTKEDDDYSKLFNERFSLNSYLNSVLLVKKSSEYLKYINTDDHLDNEISKYYVFHIARIFGSIVFKKADYQHTDIDKLDSEKITDIDNDSIELAIKILRDILDQYKENTEDGSTLVNISKTKKFSIFITEFLRENLKLYF
jgi:Ca2+-binding RTX toxin-like protein